MRTALVTGATGFIGGHVARDLMAAGWRVRALVRPESAGSPRLPEGADEVVGDLVDAAAVRRACAGADAVFHVAARYSLARHAAAAVEAQNVAGTANILAGAAAAGAPLVHTSSVATVGIPADGRLGDEDTPLPPAQIVGAYKRSKVRSEMLAMRAAAAGQHVVVVNPTAPVGPGDHSPTPTGRIITGFMAGRMPAFVDTGLNLVDVRDVAVGHRLALSAARPGGATSWGMRTSRWRRSWPPSHPSPVGAVRASACRTPSPSARRPWTSWWRARSFAASRRRRSTAR